MADIAADVAAQAEAVLAFWLDEVPADRRFVRDAALDAVIVERFGALHAEVLAGHAAGWRRDPRTLLAAVILLDQFARNIHRESPRAYAADPLARALAGEAAARGWGAGMSAVERQFLWMPFMHAETMADQLRGLALFRHVGGDAYAFAVKHAAQIGRFGRFPQRNAVLGRASSAEELAFLAEPGNHF